MVAGILTGDVMQAVSKEMFAGQTGREMVKESLARVRAESRIWRRRTRSPWKIC